METTQINLNNSCLKCARRWLQTFFVLGALQALCTVIMLFGVIEPTLFFRPEVQLISISLSLIPFLLAIYYLRKHSSVYLRTFANVFGLSLGIVMLCDFLWQVCLLIFQFGYASSAFGVFSNIHFVIQVLAAIAICMAFAALLRSEAISEYYRQPAGMLAILFFIYFALDFVYSPLNKGLLDSAYSPDTNAILAVVSSCIYILLNIGMYLSAHGLFGTPHALSEEEPDYFVTPAQLLKPGRIVVGYVVSMALLMLITYFVAAFIGQL